MSNLHDLTIPTFAADMTPSFRYVDMVPLRCTMRPELLQYYINKPPSCTDVILKRYRDPPAAAQNGPRVVTVHFMRGTDIIAKSYVPCPKTDSIFEGRAELKTIKPTDRCKEGGVCVFFRKKA